MNDLSKVKSQFSVTRPPRVSVVLTLRDAEETVSDRIADVAVDAELGRVNLSEIIIVDDGSRDGTWGALENEARHEARLRPIRLRRPFGPEAAREAGVSIATGDVIITLEPDAPASDIGQFEGLLEAGFDVVTGWRRGGPMRASWLVRQLTGLNLRNPFSGTAAYRREVLISLAQEGPALRHIPCAAHWLGYRVGEMEITVPASQTGRACVRDVVQFAGAAAGFHASEHALGLALATGVALMAAAVVCVTAALALASTFLEVAGIGLLLAGIEIAGMALLGGLILARSGSRSRVNGRIAETLLRHQAPD